MTDDRTNDREQQLRELTDQALQLLDQLAESRNAGKDLRAQLASATRRCAQLEELLSNTRRRVRASRSLRAVGRRPGGVSSLDVLLWVPASGAIHDDWLRETVSVVREASPDATCTLVCPPDLDPDTVAEIEGLQLVQADRHTPGQVFNLGIASTDGDIALFLAAGASLAPGSMENLALLHDELLALGQPRIVQGDGLVSLGLVEQGQLLVTRRVVDGDEDVEDCEFVAPEAFFVQRATHLDIGAFDEDLIGPSVLLEYALRARAASYRILPLAGWTVALPPALDLVGSAAHHDRDRLVILARHRPSEVGDALGAFEKLWDLSEEDLTVLVRAMFARLPGARDWPEGLDLFVRQALSLSRHGLSTKVLDEQLDALGDALHELHGIPCEADSARLSKIQARLGVLATQSSAAANPHVFDRLAKMVERVRLEIDAKIEFHNIASGVREQLGEFASRTEDLQAELSREQGEVRSLLEQQAEVLQSADRIRDAARETEVRSEREKARAAEELANMKRELDAMREDKERWVVRATELQTQIVQAAEDVGLESGASMAQIVSKHQGIREQLAAREGWIAALLDELTRTRLRVRPRKLQPHEERFLERLAKSEKNGSGDGRD